ncbi:hypothetical protein [Polynucleobacter sp. JS-JIR-5-A7]|uniref:hypothetical protein n=1 Tax=Polynucleobacter sp. JS-JIR-5-A7 TaxID=1758395 RepID=UPI001BFCFE65|nr:hypothetical protein [Polynucleobacter sp. JS-JIR-5-A7]QWE06955.1 hypothetical protein AOC29_01760 [Polynucleobacter sp. JS-JIR-5-A7]
MKNINNHNNCKNKFFAILIPVISFFATFVIFFLLDFIFSTSQLGNEKNKNNLVLHPSGFYELKRNYDGFQIWGNNNYRLTTDARGRRIANSQNISGCKENLYFIGDSFTYGINGPWDETFVGKFESLSKYCVVNLGVPSYSPTVYYYIYKKLIEELNGERHKFVLAVDISDVQDEATRWASGGSDSDEPREMNQQSIEKDSLRNLILQRFILTTRIIRYIKHQIFQIKGAGWPDPFLNPRSAFTWSKELQVLNNKFYPEGYAPIGIENAKGKILNNLQKINSLASNKNGEFYLLIYPWPAQIKFKSSSTNWEKFIGDACISMSKCAGLINLYPNFIEASRTDPNWYKNLFVEGDIHFNKEGNQIVANELARRIK